MKGSKEGLDEHVNICIEKTYSSKEVINSNET